VKKITSILLFILSLSSGLSGQLGGDNTYEFLNLSTGSLTTALGGLNVSNPYSDPTLSLYNPALLNNSEPGHFSINYVNYFAGINYGSAIWTGNHEKAGRFSIGMVYLNYGNFELADQAGNIEGKFRAAEYALNLGWTYRIDSLFVAGINFKPVLSNLESYNSFGLAFDAGISYTSQNGLFTAGLVISNAGFQITSYTGKREKLPTTITAGFTIKPEHAPFRISLTTHNLEKYDLTNSYTDADKEKESGQGKVSMAAENIMRHVIIGAEFLPSNNFYLATGFNYQRRRELLLENSPSTVGFSTGFGIRLSSFDLSYSRSRYHLAGAVNNISLQVKPEALIRRK
jgi:hypothetical protein